MIVAVTELADERFGRRLRRGVNVRRPQWRILVHRDPIRHAVHVGARRVDEVCPRTRVQRREDVRRADDVHLDGAVRVALGE